MRRVLVLGALAALASVALIATAGATTSGFFSVIGKVHHGHLVSGQNRFAVRGKLVEAGDRDHQVGHFRAVFNRHNRGRAVAFFHNGKIKADGHGNHLRIVEEVIPSRAAAGASGPGSPLSPSGSRFAGRAQCAIETPSQTIISETMKMAPSSARRVGLRRCQAISTTTAATRASLT
jgi:hypothetical protein